jgi:hypothetical protein
MRPDADPAADVAIVATARARELRFHAQPDVAVGFPGSGERASTQVAMRRNIDSPVEPARTYRRIVAETRITSSAP